jgi:hypothetical protein
VALGHDGRLKGDLTLFNWGDGTWWIMGSYYLRTWHMRWFNDHMQDGVHVRDLGEDMAGFSLSGPNSRAVIEKLSEAVGALPFMGCGRVRHRPDALQGRADVCSGELGYEIHCRMGDHISLREALLEAGAGEDITEYGFNALLSLRLEKASASGAQGVHPRLHAGAPPAWIAGSTGTRVTSSARLRPGRARRQRPAQKVVTLEVDATDADASGFEPVWKDGKPRGLRHLRRLRAHGGQVARHGDGEHRPDGAGDGPERAYRRRRACGPRDPALALRPRGPGDARLMDAPANRNGGAAIPKPAAPSKRDVELPQLRNPFRRDVRLLRGRGGEHARNALRMLEELGMKVLLPEAREIFAAGGAIVTDDDEMVHIGRDMVEAALKTAPNPFTAAPGPASGRDMLELGALAFQPGAGAPHATDLQPRPPPGIGLGFRDYTRLPIISMSSR